MISILPYLIIAGKSVAVYLFIIIAIRVFEKKELAQLSVINFVFILLISNSVQNAMVGDNVTLQGSLVVASGLFIANYIFIFLLRKFLKFSAVVRGEKLISIHDGKTFKENMRQFMLTKEELDQAIREHGVESMEKVNLAILEVDGNISILSDEYKHRTMKQATARA